MKIGSKIKIYNECGEIDDRNYEIVSHNSIKKNFVKIKNGDKIRHIPKDRIVKPEDIKENKLEKKKELQKFDLSTLDGILFSGEEKSHDSSMVLNPYVIVSKDGLHMKYFNLYSGSLGKKGKIPEFSNKTLIKNDKLSGDLDKIAEYLNKKGYKPVNQI